MGKVPKIYIGTSGWSYEHWREVFYPPELKSEELLSFYSKHFKTVEINSSFYHLPKETTFENWRNKVPKDFLFSVKVWRRISHLKKLKNVKDDFIIFYKRCLILENKLGPLLFQFPPNFKADKERLNNFCSDLRKIIGKKQKASFELRNETWFNPEIYEILKKYNFNLCFADTPNYPYQEEITSDYIYLRLHGRKILYASKYTTRELKEFAKKIKKWNKETYVYFDNDAYGYAIENAMELKKLL